MRVRNVLLLVCTLVVVGSVRAERRVGLEEIDRSLMVHGLRAPLEGHAVDGGPLQLAGKIFAKGLGVVAPNVLVVPVGGNAVSFAAEVGLDDSLPRTSKAAVEFRVWVDGRPAATSGLLRRNRRTAHLEVDLAGAQEVVLEAAAKNDGTELIPADWADAAFQFKDGTGPVAPRALSPQLGILTPPAPATPRLNGPDRLGVRPGSPLLYRIPATGDRPLQISVCGLPAGFTFNPTNATIQGRASVRGTYPLTVTATNAHGTATRTIKLIVGDTFALTPPMGWNSWNALTRTVSADKIRAAAAALISTGLADHGWNYVNIDDFWQRCPNETEDAALMGAVRAADGTIQPNARFPSMKALADDVHALGLRIGLYSSPGPTTCGGCAGSWLHERQDARTYAAWGFDALKYDWCSYERTAVGVGLDRLRYPFLVMGQALREQPRDILFMMCQYGQGNVSAWGATVGAVSWRTTADVFDTWGDVYGAISRQADLWPWSGPGAFNDPDLLCLGKMKWNAYKGSRLTPNEQYTHVSLWCLVGAPLMISCDLTQLDAFTFNLLSNDEVLAVDQDPLGKGAAKLFGDLFGEVWARPLADGSIAIGLLNTRLTPRKMTFDLVAAGLEGTWRVRDLWRQRDEGTVNGVYRVHVLGHATHLVRLTPVADGRLRTGLNDVRDVSWQFRFEDLRMKGGSKK